MSKSKKSIRADRTIASLAPSLVSELSPLSPFGPNDVLPRIKEPVLWRCRCGKDFEFSLADRLRGRGSWGCRECSQKAKTARRVSAIVEKRSWAAKNPGRLSFLASDNALDPHTIAPHSSEKLSFVCEAGHRFSMSATQVSVGYWCPRCSYAKRGRRTSERMRQEKGRVVSELPELARLLSPNSPVLPDDIVFFSKPVILRCVVCSSDYDVTPAKFARGDRCPFCSSHRFKTGVNDVATVFPEAVRFLSEVEQPLSHIPASRKERFPLRCPDCGTRWNSTLRSSMRCRKCSPGSRTEDAFADFLSTLGPEFVRWDRSIIRPQELDFLYPTEGKAIEFNGDYWHSDISRRSNALGMSFFEFHQRKFVHCESKGVQLGYVWESDWLSRQDDVCEAVRSWLSTGGATPGILARFESPRYGGNRELSPLVYSHLALRE